MSDYHNILVDVNNMIWKIRHSQKFDTRRKDPHAKDIILSTFIDQLSDLTKQFKADGVLCAFEGKGNWRKKVYADYKNKEVDDIYHEDVQEAIIALREFIEEKTGIKSSSVLHLEADDVIAVACQNKSPDILYTIISSDKDFVQLLKYKNVRLFSPQQDKFRDSDDPDFDLFLKCIRGDPSDNIFSAYPRVRKTKLEEAFYGESIAMINLMEHKIADEKVADRFNRNKLLIDLEAQPKDLRDNALADLQAPATGQYKQVAAVKWARDKKNPVLVEKLIEGKYTQLFNTKFKL